MTAERCGPNLLFECDECGALSPSKPDVHSPESGNGNCLQSVAWKLAQAFGWTSVVRRPPVVEFLCAECGLEGRESA